MLETAIVETPGNVDEPVWLEALPARDYQTPFYGEVKVTPEKLQRMVKNFKEGIRGQEVAVNFDHLTDKAKGNKAAGWYKDFDIRPSSADPSSVSLFALVDFTDEAKAEIKANSWKYFSLEWDDDWMDNDGEKHRDVVIGGAITNNPIAKKTMPINFSETMWKELSDDDKKLFATAVIERLNESKEWEHSEPGTGSPPAPKTDEVGDDDIAIKEGWRRGTPPDQTLPAGPDKPSSKHNETHTKEGSKVEYVFSEKELRELFSVLGIEDETSDIKPDAVVEAAKVRFGEYQELKNAVSSADQEKKFAEQYPEFWKDHNKLMERDRDNSARAFSESVKTILKSEGKGLKTTQQGLSTMALESVSEVHKKFSEGTITVEDFENCIKTIVKGGIVTFGEIGSNKEDGEDIVFDGTTPQGVAQARKLFAEVVAKEQAEDTEIDTAEAMRRAASKHPDLAELYKITLPA